MIMSPNTQVRLLSNVPLSNDYEHVMTFADRDAQASYFLSCVTHIYDEFNYQREEVAIKVPEPYDGLYNCNYLMYKNLDYGNKWFYGFITKKEYVNAGTTRIYFDLDVWQTYQFDINFLPSFIDREHCNRWNSDGTPVINTQPENLEIGTDYEVVKNEVYNGGTTNYYLLTSSTSLVDAFKRSEIPKNPPLPKPKVVQGLLTGLDYYLFSDKDASNYNPEDPNSDTAPYEGSNQNLSTEVEAYRTLMTTYCHNEGIDALVDLMLAIMMVESGGSGTDPMQIGEWAGYQEPPVTIDSAEKSIEYSCKYMKQLWDLHTSLGVDLWTMVMSYNFGGVYQRYVANRGKVHTTDLAEEYSRDIVAPSLGNTTGEKTPYYNSVSIADGRTYRYVNGGNFHYVGMVKLYFQQATNEWGIPVPSGYVVTSGYDDPSRGSHKGIDFADDLNTPIYASRDGKVIYAQFHTNSNGTPGFGNYVVIDHGDGLFSGYAHQNSINVTVNQEVVRGERIGSMGSTGDSTGVHLHFNISDGLFGNYQNPAPLLGLDPNIGNS